MDCVVERTALHLTPEDTSPHLREAVPTALTSVERKGCYAVNAHHGIKPVFE